MVPYNHSFLFLSFSYIIQSQSCRTILHFSFLNCCPFTPFLTSVPHYYTNLASFVLSSFHKLLALIYISFLCFLTHSFLHISVLYPFINFRPRSFIYLSLSSSFCVPPPHHQTIHILSSVSACSISVCEWMTEMNGLASGMLYYVRTWRHLLPVCPILSHPCTHTNIYSHNAGLNQCQQCGEETKWTNNWQRHIRRDWCWDGGGQKVIRKREET